MNDCGITGNDTRSGIYNTVSGTLFMSNCTVSGNAIPAQRNDYGPGPSTVKPTGNANAGAKHVTKLDAGRTTGSAARTAAG